MSAQKVFVSGGGRRYHSFLHCPALVNGQAFWDWDCPDDYCNHTYHGHPRAIHELSPAVAVANGKTACLACRPETPAGPPPWDDFGHAPQSIYTDGPERQCRACTRRFGDVIVWPCATARVLELAER